MKRKPWVITADKVLTEMQISGLNKYLIDKRDLAISRGCSDKQSVKEYYLILGILGSGARVSETAALKNSDLMGHKLTIRRGKGGKPRTVLLTRQTAQLLKEWIAVKEQLGLSHEAEEPLFPSRYGDHYSVRGIQTVVKKVFAALKFPRHLSCHSLRHSNCSLLLQTGKVSLARIRDNLGHHSISVTDKYSHAIGNLEDVDLFDNGTVENNEKSALGKKTSPVSNGNHVQRFLKNKRKANFK